MTQFSFILIARESSQCEEALRALTRLAADAGNIEVIVASGRNPSAQRNEAASIASGEYLVFLDNDSIVDERILHYYQDALGYEEGIGIVGGPSVYGSKTGGFKTAVQAVFSSVFGLGPFRSRYMSLGHVQRATEEKLILCNMLIRRDLFLSENGFNTNLYPNEENEFLNRVREKTKIYYHPLAICYRDPRGTMRDFCRQMITYGEGRARNLYMFPQFWNSIFLIPVMFAFYLMALPWMSLLLEPKMFLIASAPFAVYAAFNISASVFAFLSYRKVGLLALLPFMFLSCHLFYGLGLVWGLAKQPFAQDRPIGTIQVTRLKSFGQAWGPFGKVAPGKKSRAS